MHYRVTLADAMTAHDKALTFGGREGISSLHLIESALGRPYSGYHRGIASKCAALLEAWSETMALLTGTSEPLGFWSSF